MLRSLLRLALVLVISALLATACGDDIDIATEEPPDTDQTTLPGDGLDVESDDTPDADDEPATTTTEAGSDTTTTTTTVTGDGPTGVLAEGSVTTAEGLISRWSLTATESTLCFEADLTHPDPGLAEAGGTGVSACLEPTGGLDEMETGLSVDVGTVDGEKTIGFLWGRVAPEVIALTIEHTDGTQTPIDILAGPTDVQVFAYVVEVATLPEVQDLDAVSGTQLEGSAPIRDFLRSGPTYPVVTSTPPTTPDYPVS